MKKYQNSTKRKPPATETAPAGIFWKWNTNTKDVGIGGNVKNKNSMDLREQIRNEVISARILAKTVDEAVDAILILSSVGSSLPDLAECNQASLDYATKKDNPDFFLIKQTFKEGINWALNYVTKQK